MTRGSASPLARLQERIAAVPLPRLRRILLALYLLTAVADAAGKALATNDAVNRAISRVVPSARRPALEGASRPGGNFEIFRTAAQHVVREQDLYAEYPAQHVDRFKYSPTFAVLFTPFAWLAWPLALFLWSALNALLLFWAVERVLPPRAALVAMAWMLLEVLRAMQNAQSNALVAALIVLAFAELERRRAWGAAAAVAVGASVKIFPLAALSFALPRRLVFRTGVWAAIAGGAALALPLLVTPPDVLVAQYRSWFAIESVDAFQRWFSVMGVAQHLFVRDWPNWPFQLGGALALMVPLLLRRERWDDPRFRLLYLCSVLLFTVLFNHQAERASYVIGFAGICIWYAAEPPATWRAVLFALAFVTMPLMSTLVPGALLRTPTAMMYRLAIPSLLVWLALQRELLQRARA